MKVDIGPYPKGNSKKKRKIKVKIHGYDIWSMDQTLAEIIYPMLKQMKERKCGAPGTDDSDVPKELRSTSAPPLKEEWHTDKNWFKRWNWIVEEMCWTFEQLVNDWEENYYASNEGKLTHIWAETEESVEANTDTKLFRRMKLTKLLRSDLHDNFYRFARTNHQNKINNGLRLFGKYYQALWT